jgi:hypothetical protein
MRSSSFCWYECKPAPLETVLTHVLQNHNNDVNHALNKYFDNLGSLSSLKYELRNSSTKAKWDETGFGGAAYGADDGNIPSTSAPVKEASKSNKADRCWFQLSILTMLQVLRTTPTAQHPRAQIRGRALPPRKPRPATRQCRVSYTREGRSCCVLQSSSVQEFSEVLIGLCRATS